MPRGDGLGRDEVAATKRALNHIGRVTFEFDQLVAQLNLLPADGETAVRKFVGDVTAIEDALTNIRGWLLDQRTERV